jgi:predicted nucleic acid-binding protein
LRLLLDTSVLIEGQIPAEPEVAISVVSLAELHFGLLIARDEETRAQRASRLGQIEARFPDPLPVDDRVARQWGRLKAAVAVRGGRPRKRLTDLAIAATANGHGTPLITHNLKDFKIVEDLIDVRAAERAIREQDIVELTEPVDDAPAGARGGVLELRPGGTAMIEITEPVLDAAARIVFAPLRKLRVVDPAP